MNKSLIVIGSSCLVVGFFVGFAYTNSRNRDYIKEQGEKARAEAFSAAGSNPNVSVSDGGVPQGAPPSDTIHQNPNVDTAIKEAAANRGDYEKQKTLGEFLAQNGKIPEARECFEAAVKLKPDDWRSTAILGFMFYQERKYPEAITRYEQAYKLKADEPQIIVGLGNAHFDAEHWEDAAKWYEKTLQLTPNDVNVITDLGLTYYKRKPQQTPKAIEYFKKALTVEPTHPQTLFNYANVLIEINQTEQAKEIVARFEKAAPQQTQEVAALKQKLAQTNTSGNIPSH